LHRREGRSTLRKGGYDHRVGSSGLRERWRRRGEGTMRKVRGSDTGIGEGRDQRLGEGKEAWSSSTAN